MMSHLVLLLPHLVLLSLCPLMASAGALRCLAATTRSALCRSLDKTCTTNPLGDDLSEAISSDQLFLSKAACDRSVQEMARTGQAEAKRAWDEAEALRCPARREPFQRPDCARLFSVQDVCASLSRLTRMGGQRCINDADCGLVTCWKSCTTCFSEQKCNASVAAGEVAPANQPLCITMAGSAAVSSGWPALLAITVLLLVT